MLKIANEVEKDKYKKFRIHSFGLRVRDFSLNNIFLRPSARGYLEFRTLKGDKKNWQKISSSSDIYLDPEYGIIHISVKGPVLNGDNEERYKWADSQSNE